MFLCDIIYISVHVVFCLIDTKIKITSNIQHWHAYSQLVVFRPCLDYIANICISIIYMRHKRPRVVKVCIVTNILLSEPGQFLWWYQPHQEIMTDVRHQTSVLFLRPCLTYLWCYPVSHWWWWWWSNKQTNKGDELLETLNSSIPSIDILYWILFLIPKRFSDLSQPFWENPTYVLTGKVVLSIILLLKCSFLIFKFNNQKKPFTRNGIINISSVICALNRKLLDSLDGRIGVDFGV